METNRHFTMHLAKPNVLSPTSVILIIRSPHGIWSSTNSQMGLEQVFSPQDCFSHEIKASEHLGSQHTCLNSAPSPTGCMTLSTRLTLLGLSFLICRRGITPPWLAQDCWTNTAVLARTRQTVDPAVGMDKLVPCCPPPRTPYSHFMLHWMKIFFKKYYLAASGLSCGTWAKLLCSTWALSSPTRDQTSSALQSRFSTTRATGKSWKTCLSRMLEPRAQQTKAG